MASGEITWAEVLHLARTGDLVLFHTDKLLGKAIDAVTGGGQYSHVGMVVRPDPATAPLFWEESSVVIARDPDSPATPTHTGAQVGGLRAAVTKYMTVDDRPSYRRLHVERTPAFEAAVQDVIRTLEGHAFGTWTTMVEHWFEARFLERATPDTQMFCSQLVALTFQRVGLLGLEHPPNWYSPNSFSSEKDELRLLQGASFDREVPIAVG